MEHMLSRRAGPDRPDRPLTEQTRRLIEELYQPLRRFAGVLGPLDVDPDDLLHEAFLRALRVRPLEHYEHPGAYLRRTLLSIASNRRRAFGRRQRALARLSANEEIAQQPQYPSDVSELLGLAARDRALLWLADIEGWSYAEIAPVLHCSEQAARMRASRCRQRLRAALREED